MLWVKRVISAGLLILLVAQAVHLVVPGDGAYLFSALAVFLLALIWYTVSAPVGVRVLRARPLADPQLEASVQAYAKLMGLARPPALHVAELPVANAYAFGRPGLSAVVLTARLLDGLHPLQLTAILGHELHHIRARDTLFTVFAATVQLVLRVLSWAGVAAAVVFGIGLALLNVAAAMFGATSPRGGFGVVGLARETGAAVQRLGVMLSGFMSREAELRADLAGAKLAAAVTGEPEVMGGRYMASALRAMERLNGRGAQGGFVTALMSTHPSLERRLRNLEQL